VRPDHLNWHASFKEYVADKLRVFEGQREGELALVSARDPVGRDADLAAEKLVVGEGDTAVRDGRLLLRGSHLVDASALPAPVLRDGRVARHPVQPGRELRVSAETPETPPRFQVRVLRSLGGVARVVQDPEAQRVDLPVREPDELLPGALVAALAAFDEIEWNELPSRITPVLPRTPHDNEGYRREAQ